MEATSTYGAGASTGDEAAPPGASAPESGAESAEAWSAARHALRARLTNFRLYLGLLQTGPVDRHDRYLSVLHAEVDRLAVLIDALGRDGPGEAQ